MKKVCTILLSIIGLAGLSLSALADESPKLEGKKVAILIGDGFHDGETLEPKFYLRQHGAEVTLISTHAGKLQAYNSSVTLPIEVTLADVSADEFDGLVLPGGQGPENIRRDQNVQRFVREFAALDRPIAAICHGPQILASAGVIEGRKTTCFPGIFEEMADYGAEVDDVEVMVDGNLITSRLPGDIPAFLNALTEALTAS